MRDRTYQAIVDAMERFSTGSSSKTNGKLSKANLAREAGVSKATLYRYLNAYENELWGPFNALQREDLNNGSLSRNRIEGDDELRKEVKMLTALNAAERKESARLIKQKAHQIIVLWTEVDRLSQENARLLNKLNKS